MDSPSAKSLVPTANTASIVNNSNGAESDRDMLMADEELLDESAMMEEDVTESVNGESGASASGRRGSTSSSGYRRTSSRQVPGKKEGFYQETSGENASAPQDGLALNATRRASFASTANSQTVPGFNNTSEDRLATYNEALERIKSLESVLSSNKSVYFEEKLSKLKDEMDALFKGSHPVVLDKSKKLELEKKNRIWVAGLWKKHQLECLKTIFSKEKQSVEDDYKTERDGLREKMSSALQEKRRKLEEDSSEALVDFTMDTNVSGEPSQTTTSSSRANTRKLRKRAANEQQGDRTSSRKKQTLGPSIAFEAKDNEVNDDLMTLRKQSMIGVSAVGMAFGSSATGLSINSSGIRSSTRRYQTEETVEVHFESGILYIEERPFRKNDLISVYNVANNDTFEATILSINSTDMWLQKSDAGKIKIYMSQIRTGKYVLELV